MTRNKFKLVSKDYLTLISGPCAIESETMAMRTAETLKNISEKLKINFIYKSSILFRSRLLKASSARVLQLTKSLKNNKSL